MENYMVWIWLAIFVISVVVEASTQELVSIWFALAAIITLALSFIMPWWAEIIVFCVLSLVALIATRPLCKKMLARSVRHTNADEFIGKRIKAETDITKFDGGEVKLNGIIYTAILMESEEETISKDSLVEVISLKGNKAVVKKIEG